MSSPVSIGINDIKSEADPIEEIALGTVVAASKNPEYDEENKYVELQLAKARLNEYLQNIGQRKIYADKLYSLCIYWVGCVMAIIIANAFELEIPCLNSPKFHVSDTVILALIGGTTASVFGMFHVVIKYLFPSK